VQKKDGGKLAKSYYEPQQKSSLFDVALQTGARAIAGQLVGDFFDKVPEELKHATSMEKAQINAVTKGETDALAEIRSVSTMIGGLTDLAKINAKRVEGEPDVLADRFATIESALTRLAGDDNISYYDLSSPDDDTLTTISGTSVPVQRQARLMLDTFKGAKGVYEHIGKVHEDNNALIESLNTLRASAQGGTFVSDQESLNNVIDSIRSIYENNIRLGGDDIIDSKALDRTTNNLQAWAQANHKAALTDWDAKTPGIQFAGEIMKNATVDLGDWNVSKDLRNTIIDDLKKNNYMQEGGQTISYQQGANMAMHYLQTGEPIKANAIFDKIIPGGSAFENKKQISALMTANETLDFQKATALQKQMNKRVSTLKAVIDNDNESQKAAASVYYGNTKTLNDGIFDDVGRVTGRSWKYGGTEEEVTRLFGLVGTGDWEPKEDVIPLAQLASDYTNQYSSPIKYASNVPDQNIRAAVDGRARQEQAAKPLLKVLLFSGVGKAKGIIQDENGKEWTYDTMDELTDKQAYKLLKDSESHGGLNWLLGLNTGNVEISDEERQQIITKNLRDIDPTGKGKKDKSAWSTNVAMKGEDTKLVFKMANHWYTHEKLLDNIASPDKIAGMNEQKMKMDFYRGLLNGQLKLNFVESLGGPAEKAWLKEIEDGIKVAAGANVIKVDGEEFVIPKVTYDKDAKALVAAEIAKRNKERIDLDNFQIDLAAQDQPLPGDDVVINRSLDNLLNPQLNIDAMDADSSDFSSTDSSDYALAIDDSGSITPKDVDARQYAEWMRETGQLGQGGDVSVVPTDKVEESLKNLELQSIVLTGREKMEFTKMSNYGDKMTSLERRQFRKDGIVPQKLIGAYNKDKTLSYGNELTEDFKEIEELKNYLVKAESRVDEQLKNQGKGHTYTDKTMQSARRNVRITLDKIKRLEMGVRSNIGKSINPTTGLLSDTSTNKAIYDLLARAFPNKSIEELQQMMMQYSTSETEDYALTK